MNNSNEPVVLDLTQQLKADGFAVYEIKNEINIFRHYNRKNFYKICLITSSNTIHYAERSFETSDTILFFGNPRIPYSWKVTSPEFNGYCCLFTEEFLKGANRSESLQQSPLFKMGGTPVFNLDNEQGKFIYTIFQKMHAESETDYTFKTELIRNCIQLIIHEALKMRPSNDFSTNKNATERIATVFLDLLERQFPIENPEQPLQLKTAQDFAKALAVHVNYLDRAVKEITGKSTSAHISERIVREAKMLLQHTDWNIATIAYALGFVYPSYFNIHFKKLTGTSPKLLRAQKV